LPDRIVLVATSLTLVVRIKNVVYVVKVGTAVRRKEIVKTAVNLAYVATVLERARFALKVMLSVVTITKNVAAAAKLVGTDACDVIKQGQDVATCALLVFNLILKPSHASRGLCG